MKTIPARIFVLILSLCGTTALRADSQLSSWFTTYSGQYARIYSNAAAQSSGSAVTTWSNGTQTQSKPAYAGVQEVDYSTNWIYINTTGLGFHVMGAWSTGFPNLPDNQKVTYRIPRTATITNAPTTKTLNGANWIGFFVDGVAMFNSWDANYWSGTADVSAGSTTAGYWNRDAYVNEGATFDPAYAHQQQGGTYHYHADPIALRYLLGDHVTYNSTAKTYAESTAAVTKHSPILGWVADGYPIYGPYGYSNPTNPASGVRRMVSGYVPRNGQNGTDNISTTGAARTYLPAWALREYTNMSLGGTTNGPAVSSSYPFGRYMEDNAFLGDCTNPNTSQKYVQGVDFDLDEYNGRFCYTPEFPNGTYAYFVSISSNAVPTYPYNIGHAYYGNPTGGSVNFIAETVATNFVGGPNASTKLATPAWSNNTVTLTWSAVEGGTYQVQSSGSLTSWATNASGIAPVTNLAPVGITGSYSGSSSAKNAFFRIARTALAAYDSAASSGSGITSISPTSGSRGTTFTLTINLDSSVNPPPQNAPINSITVGSITGSNNVHVSSTQVTSSITIPSNASTNAQTVTVVFPGPPDNPTNYFTCTLINGFTIN